MKVLIQDSRPDRLIAWLSQVQRPGRICHLANTAHQAQLMLLSDPYDLVLLEATEAEACATQLGELALQRNPDCRIVDLPEVVGLPEVAQDAETKSSVVRWRKFRSTPRKDGRRGIRGQMARFPKPGDLGSCGR